MFENDDRAHNDSQSLPCLEKQPCAKKEFRDKIKLMEMERGHQFGFSRCFIYIVKE